MTTYRTESGDLVQPGKATGSWAEQRDWNGNNNIGRSSGSQWQRQTLYRSSKGRFYIVDESDYQGTPDTAAFVTPQEAAAFLILNEHELPEDLAAIADDLVE